MNFESQIKSSEKITPAVSGYDRLLSEDMKSHVEQILRQVEEDERTLSYNTSCQSEAARKQSGSYYTPRDVAAFFWDQFFEINALSCNNKVTEYIRNHTFVEPAAGSGVLIFTLLKKLLSLHVPLQEIQQLDLRVIDINSDATSYIRWQFSRLEAMIGGSFANVRWENCDFRHFDASATDKPYIFFGNPPFVTNPPGSRWKNLYADFLSIALDQMSDAGCVHFILPLSVAFSRDYADIRTWLREKRYDVFASHFDNIPDTLFKAGKPKNTNTNKANSQRCTILTAVSSGIGKFHSTMLYRWSSGERSRFLQSKPIYRDVSIYSLDNQIFRPASKEIADYVMKSKVQYRLGDIVSALGKHEVHVSSVARNFIGIKKEPGSGANSFQFTEKESFYRFLLLVGSDMFLEYWRSIGDGFHVTRSNIVNFPVSKEIDTLLAELMPIAKRVWSKRRRYEKRKLNSGVMSCSYDLTTGFPSILQKAFPTRTNGTITISEEIDAVSSNPQW